MSNPASTRVERGEGWELHLAECVHWMRNAEPRSFDALVADPPYCSGAPDAAGKSADPAKKYSVAARREGSHLKGYEGDSRDQRSFAFWTTLWLSAARNLLRDGAPTCVFTDWRQLPATTDALQAGGFVWRGICQWTKKNASRPVRGRFRCDAEYVVWGSRGAMPLAGESPPGTWTIAPVHSSERVHVNQKPVDVLAGVLAIVPPGGLVLDPFAGAATTGVAALQSGRRFVGIEQDPYHFEHAVRRLREVAQ